MRKIWLLALTAALLTTACRIETNVLIDINADQTGSFGFEFGMDDEFRQLMASEGGGFEVDDLLGGFTGDLPGATATSWTYVAGTTMRGPLRCSDRPPSMAPPLPNVWVANSRPRTDWPVDRHLRSRIFVRSCRTAVPFSARTRVPPKSFRSRRLGRTFMPGRRVHAARSDARVAAARPSRHTSPG